MKFSIVTPTYNSEKFIEETIKSVLSQKGDFEIEYIIVDGASNDGTGEIITKYLDLAKSNKLECYCNSIAIKYISEKDDSMYDAINKGFSIATGDIYAWINSDDIYLADAFKTVSEVFKLNADLNWIKGITSYIDSYSRITSLGNCNLYNRNFLQLGVYGVAKYFVQQDSVFWTSDIWEKSGGIDNNLKYAGDYSLWVKFSKYSELVSFNSYVSCFRKYDGQLSKNVTAYYKECEYITKLNYYLKKKILLYFCIIEPKVSKKIRPLIFSLYFGKHDYYYIDTAKTTSPVKRTGYYRIS